jgi:IclR family transcriptional regulator, KDG regulon repressor
MEDTSQVKTIDRLVGVLDCFTAERATWSLAELAVQLDLPKSTLHRFLVGLEMHGILRRDARDKKWRLGYHLFIWGSLAAESTGLRHIARPVLHELAGVTGETALLTVYHNQEVICTDKVETNHHVRLSLEVGARRMCHAGASSKALMAFLPEVEIDAIIHNKGLPKLCANTITQPEALKAELALIRERGYAVSLEETDPGAWGVAAPIRGWSDEMVGAVGVAGPTLRYDDDKLREYAVCCREAARKVSSLLSNNPSYQLT